MWVGPPDCPQNGRWAHVRPAHDCALAPSRTPTMPAPLCAACGAAPSLREAVVRGFLSCGLGPHLGLCGRLAASLPAFLRILRTSECGHVCAPAGAGVRRKAGVRRAGGRHNKGGPLVCGDTKTARPRRLLPRLLRILAPVRMCAMRRTRLTTFGGRAEQGRPWAARFVLFLAWTAPPLLRKQRAGLGSARLFRTSLAQCGDGAMRRLGAENERGRWSGAGARRTTSMKEVHSSPSSLLFRRTLVRRAAQFRRTAPGRVWGSVAQHAVGGSSTKRWSVCPHCTFTFSFF